MKTSVNRKAPCSSSDGVGRFGERVDQQLNFLSKMQVRFPSKQSFRKVEILSVNHLELTSEQRLILKGKLTTYKCSKCPINFATNKTTPTDSSSKSSQQQFVNSHDTKFHLVTKIYSRDIIFLSLIKIQGNIQTPSLLYPPQRFTTGSAPLHRLPPHPRCPPAPQHPSFGSLRRLC